VSVAHEVVRSSLVAIACSSSFSFLPGLGGGSGWSTAAGGHAVGIVLLYDKLNAKAQSWRLASVRTHPWQTSSSRAYAGAAPAVCGRS